MHLRPFSRVLFGDIPLHQQAHCLFSRNLRHGRLWRGWVDIAVGVLPGLRIDVFEPVVEIIRRHEAHLHRHGVKRHGPQLLQNLAFERLVGIEGIRLELKLKLPLHFRGIVNHFVRVGPWRTHAENPVLFLARQVDAVQIVELAVDFGKSHEEAANDPLRSCRSLLQDRVHAPSGAEGRGLSLRNPPELQFANHGLSLRPLVEDRHEVQRHRVTLRGNLREHNIALRV